MNLNQFFLSALERNGVERKYLDILGHQTHILQAGTGNAQLLWFPAVGDSSSSFGRVLLMLATKLDGIARITAIDPPGYDRSPFPPEKEMLGFEEL